MAKTKQDFYKEGAEHARTQKAKGNDTSPESLGYLGQSWQAKAFAQGFHDTVLTFGDFYSKAGDSRLNKDGSTSILVDNGDGTLGTKTINCPKPVSPVIFTPHAEVHISGKLRTISAQRKRELKKRGISCQFLYNTPNGKARYGWTPH